jgi:hypothetical protein
MNSRVPDLAAIGPRAPGAQAQLLFALLLAALLAIALPFVPLQTHAVSLDFESPPGLAPFDWAQPSPLRPDRRAIDVPAPYRAPAAAAHRLDIERSGSLLFDGCRLDLLSLRLRLDRLEMEDGFGWVDLRPDPEARYETVDEILATLARAHVGRFRLDTRHFAAAIDAPEPQRAEPPRRKPTAACPPPEPLPID